VNHRSSALGAEECVRARDDDRDGMLHDEWKQEREEQQRISVDKSTGADLQAPQRALERITAVAPLEPAVTVGACEAHGGLASTTLFFTHCAESHDAMLKRMRYQAGPMLVEARGL
jgi:hypothetical protein